jgi:hypothetical protein
MEQSSQNENKINNEHGCEIMDDAMEKITREPSDMPFENHDILQIELRENEIMKYNFKNNHVQRNKWKNHNRNEIYWAFYCINDKNEVDVKCF